MENFFDQYRDEVQPALKSKLEEFILFGYDSVTEEELWQYLCKKKWKREREAKLLYQIVNDILSVKIGEYMNFATVEAFKSPDWFGNQGKDELSKLL
ncbi:post-transcriptional regulator [Litchfieldia salsa]|uniref:Post-transcriptional regulator n=1 Tax=Litchfieldia salsa TaxID=930152 RepID=A0A1H0V5U1_9BACI|nr:post-transcriptional regulator [Litchfieldia salsa]SDP73714.1 Post-transcriptional regulator [Litchfieldia salsa]